MPEKNYTRRGIVKSATAGIVASYLPSISHAQSRPRVVVIGGGFGGATFARFLLRADPNVNVTLIEPSATYTACPLSNLVLNGQRELSEQEFAYDALKSEGIEVVTDVALDVDPVAKVVSTPRRGTIAYDKLLMAPGIDLNWEGLPGYDLEAAKTFPHAWKAGSQTQLLWDQIRTMENGGVVVLSAPANPYRCPPGPYERASMIAHYLKTSKPKSKLIVLDAKDKFSKQSLFRQAWEETYGSTLEWVGLSDGGAVVSVNAQERTVETDFDQFKPDVANIIPPQKAAQIAERAGVADATGWCPIDPVTFESQLQKDIHVLGDASIANAMPKSAFSANAQAKVCAIQMARLFRGAPPMRTTLINTCYSLVTPDYGISVAGIYRPGGQSFVEVPGAGGTSSLEAGPEIRQAEARYARDWFKTITSEVFG